MLARLQVEVEGAVQGVGFRPFIFRLAEELALTGWVLNDPHGVTIEVEGARPRLEQFLRRLPAERPPHARLHGLHAAWLAPAGYQRFEIRESQAAGDRTAVVLPDLAPCPDCMREIADRADRRAGYVFTNCTHCGPRFSIIRALPYDRPNTTMASFTLCPACRAEYDDPRDRRFHAQPTACPVCGPRLWLCAPDGTAVARDLDAIDAAAAAITGGRIVAVKGLGGFHLVVDARHAGAVGRLRQRKHREEKPLALLVRDVPAARDLCTVSGEAARALASPERPILLLPRRDGDGAAAVAHEVAPGTPELGLMLPPTPLHHLLMERLDGPVVATSGNRTDEPICTDETEALERLDGIADLFLVHDRPIARHVDDSVARVVGGELRLLRRARGWAPLPVLLPFEVPPILAVGAYLKNVVALGVGRGVFLSQHIGDLGTPEAMRAFERVIDDFLALYGAQPVAIAHDLHPDYPSTAWAREAGGPLAGLPRIGVQHHHAHLAACLADAGLEQPDDVLGVTWDGAGHGSDGTTWGGEFLAGSRHAFRRIAFLRPFSLPGGDAAAREPRRCALGVLWEMEGERCLARAGLPPIDSFSAPERSALGAMLARGTRAPRTTSAGRLFDAVSSLLGIRQRTSFEGQAAMQLEHVADPGEAGAYPLPLVGSELDWGPLVEDLLEDRRRGAGPGAMSARFHGALAEGIAAVARRAALPRVALAGGCFQNRLLEARTTARLEADGFEVIVHRQVPPNDGSIALGQVVIAAAALEGRAAAA